MRGEKGSGEASIEAVTRDEVRWGEERGELRVRKKQEHKMQIKMRALQKESTGVPS